MSVSDYREKLRNAALKSSDWRKAAREDFGFYNGKSQWEADVASKLKKQGRPAITINKIRSTINLLVGHFGANMLEPRFLPRGEGDYEICQAALGITKYVYDRANYRHTKINVYQDKCISGQGWFYYGVEIDPYTLEPKIVIKRKSFNSMFLDPESIESDMSDATYIDDCSWVNKDKLALIYPENKDDIELMMHDYDSAEEKALEMAGDEYLWYNKTTKQVRVVTHWFKEAYNKEIYDSSGMEPDIRQAFANAGFGPGTILAKDLPKEIRSYLSSLDIKPIVIQADKIKVAVYAGELELEKAKTSPYKHGYFPFVRDLAYYTGEDDSNNADEPHGVVRDLKDPQRLLNKVRSQSMHILNTMAVKNIRYQKGSLNAAQREFWSKNAATPGALLEADDLNGVRDADTSQFPTGLGQMEQITQGDFRFISGINEEFLGMDTGTSTSGRAIELRQRQAMTQIAMLIEGSRQAEEQGLRLLWGTTKTPGLVPQFLNQEKVMRVLDDNNQNKFITVMPGLDQGMKEQPKIDQMTGQQQVDDKGQLVTELLYDLSKFEFDIVVDEAPNSPTARISQRDDLVAALQAGVPIPPDIVLKFFDFPEKQQAIEQLKQQPAKGPQISANVSIDLAILPPQYQEMLLQAVVQSGNIKANFKEQQPVINPQMQGGVM